jgi:uncharacterized membrane-anchored protein YjiN (DUF445 family)
MAPQHDGIESNRARAGKDRTELGRLGSIYITVYGARHRAHCTSRFMATTTPPLKEDPDKQIELDRMKRRATALLAIVATIFVVALLFESAQPWVGYVRAAAEAAIVGGLADWFAVTALFRHPLGIPIPHTAIVPTNKNRIGRSMGDFVQHNFLAPDVIAARLKTLRVAERIVRWVIVPEHADRLSRTAARSLAGGAQILRDEEVQMLIDSALIERIRNVRVAPFVGRALAHLTEQGRHQRLLDEALRTAAHLIDENEAMIRARVRAETPWWIPEIVDEKIHEKIVSGIKHTLDEVSENPEHPLRHRLNAAVERTVVRLQEAPDLTARVDALKEAALAHPVLREFLLSLWTDAKRALIDAAERQDDDAGIREISLGLQSTARTVLADAALMEKLDRWLVDVVIGLIAEYRDEVGDFIAETVASWDTEATSRKIELQIGRDLQFVRVNGTLVGGLVGLFLYAASRFLG